MRVVLDTNTIDSGIISPGSPPRQLVDAAKAGAFELVTSSTLLAELLDVLGRNKLAARLHAAALTPQASPTTCAAAPPSSPPQLVPRIVTRVLDTNAVVAGLPWNGPPRRPLELAIEAETVELFSTPASSPPNSNRVHGLHHHGRTRVGLNPTESESRGPPCVPLSSSASRCPTRWPRQCARKSRPASTPRKAK